MSTDKTEQEQQARNEYLDPGASEHMYFQMQW